MVTENKASCVFFLSLDLNGATQFKSDFEYWPSAFSKFFRDLQERLNSFDAREPGLPKLSQWKYLGDEVILSAEVHNIDDVISLYHMSDLLAAELDAGVRGYADGLTWLPEVAERRVKQPESTPTLGVKGCAWLALIRPYASGIYNAQHYELSFERYLEVVGPRMDAAFRVAKFAAPNKLVLTPELAYLLLTHWDNASYRIFFKHWEENLKGVWPGVKYPVLQSVSYPSQLLRERASVDEAVDEVCEHYYVERADPAAILAAMETANVGFDKIEAHLGV